VIYAPRTITSVHHHLFGVLYVPEAAVVGDGKVLSVVSAENDPIMVTGLKMFTDSVPAGTVDELVEKLGVRRGAVTWRGHARERGFTDVAVWRGLVRPERVADENFEFMGSEKAGDVEVAVYGLKRPVFSLFREWWETQHRGFDPRVSALSVGDLVADVLGADVVPLGVGVGARVDMAAYRLVGADESTEVRASAGDVYYKDYFDTRGLTEIVIAARYK